ncbi:MAG: M50 family metallopeptidase [Chloroflexi bacterium]|nr:M50 family metallopeptidase [Chloroflexota bacterium]
MSALFDVATSILLFILVLGGLVLVHELGHFVTARLARVRVLEFGIGFPPRAKSLGRGGVSAEDAASYRLRRAEAIEQAQGDPERLEAILESPENPPGTLYTLNWLPIGGFVKLEDENGGDSGDPRSFGRARLSTKLVILVAGVAMNLLVAFVIFTGIALVGEPALGVTFSEIVVGSPAEGAGLQAGDTLTSINGVRYSVFDQQFPTDDLRALAGQAVVLGILHADGSSEEVTVTLRIPASPNEGALGVGGLAGTQLEDIRYGPGEAIAVGAQRTADAFGMILDGLGKIGRSIVTDPTSAPPASGPVGIAGQLSSVLADLGPLYLLYMIGILSANLALVNVLPFPPLDGGRMLMLVLKALPGGNRISLRAEQLTYAVGFVFLFAFLIWITVFDVIRQVGGGTP